MKNLTFLKTKRFLIEFRFEPEVGFQFKTFLIQSKYITHEIFLPFVSIWVHDNTEVSL